MIAWILFATTGFMLSLYDNHQAEKERFWRNRKKSKNYCQKNVYVRITYYSFMCVCVWGGGYICILLCVVVYVIVSMCMCMMIYAPQSRRVCYRIFSEGVWDVFSGGSSIGIADDGGGDRLCVLVEMRK